MRYRVLAASAVFGTFLLTACGTATTPGSAYDGATTTVMSSTSPAAPGMGRVPASGMSSTAARSSAVLTVRKTPIGYVLANANGFTVYWFAKDPRGGSHPACAGTCLLAWFPVKGHPMAADGVRLGGKLACITRPGGVMQATYSGHPLYTFGSDSAPGQTNGNGSAGSWHVIRVKAPAATSPPGY
jgi:predicted lipoprotein with Yx(FWY)xxD motif